MESDPLPLWMKLCLVLLLILLNAFFVAAEFAMVKIRSSRIDALVEQGNLKAKMAGRIIGNLNAYLSACQLGITLASLGLGWLGEPVVSALLDPVFQRILPSGVIETVSFLISFIIITTFHITLGEQYPKTYAIRKAEEITMWSALPMIVFYYVMLPFIWFLNGMSNWLLRRSGIEPEKGHESAHTEEEIRVLMKESHESGYIDNTELTMVDNIFEFSETHAREIMIPRTEMKCLYTQTPYAENKELAIQELHTRYPICDPDKDNIIGFVHIKDMMKAPDDLGDIRKITRPLLNVPESMPISFVLKMMQKRRTEMALLIDEYGGTSGLVTIEDILEEIVGEIRDEFDEERPRIEKKDDRHYSVDGLLLIEEFNEYFGTELESDDFDTIGGWVYAQVELPPRKNQRVLVDHHELIIEETEHMRVSRLTVRYHTESVQKTEKQIV